MKKLITQFKEFVQETDFSTVAIGFLVATAVKDLCTSFFNTIVTPILNAILGLFGQQSSEGVVTIFNIQFQLSDFVSQIISFFAMMIIAFFFMKGYNFIIKGKADVEVDEDDEESEETKLLREILEELKKNNK